eukprot:90584_1
MSTKPRKRKRKRSNDTDTCFKRTIAAPPIKRRKTVQDQHSLSRSHLLSQSSIVPAPHPNENQDISNHSTCTATHKPKANSDDTLHFKYESDFDENGFIFYLGTDRKTSNTFTNPADNGLITITAPPLMHDSVSKNHLLGRKAVRLISKAIQNAAFIIDFTSTQYQISPTHYTLRHYESWDAEAIRNWQFCGSNDGIQWTVLKQHNNDTSLKTRGQSCTWPITDCIDYYSLFRIYQFGSNSNDSHYLCVSGFEIYGNVRKQSVPGSSRVPRSVSIDSDIEILANWPISPQTKAQEPPTDDTQLQQALAESLLIETSSNIVDTCRPKDTLLSMGYDEYMVSECMKYMDMNGDVLSNAMDWLSTHDITECETKNNKIVNLCTIIECARYKALHALKQCDHNTGRALESLMNTNTDPLSAQQIEDLQTEDSILTATLSSIGDVRQKEQQFKKIKPLIVSELRSMGFLQIAVRKAVHAPGVMDKKSAIRYILSHPLDRVEESNAKIQEIMNSGYSNHDAVTALNRSAQNLEMSMLWLMQGKPAKIKQFMYHVESKRVVQISRHESNQRSEVRLSDEIHFKNANQHWTLYDDGRIKNFANNEVLMVRKQVKSDDVEYELSVIHEAKECEEDHAMSVWEMDENEKTIQNKGCGLYLVYRMDSKHQQFNLERKIHCGDLSQRWCFVDYNELIELNPKELAKSLDSQEFECVICWEREPNLRLEPCGHASFCEKCINELKPTECPICRTKIHSKRQCR